MDSVARDEARDFIDQLRIHNGVITPDDIEYLKKNRPHVLESIYSMQQQLGASTKLLASQLYHKQTRFVYELIQNAEDNQYSVPQPHLSFTLEPNQITIDSNEDGFTKENVKAISSVAMSTKTAIRGYIGEKGIGFKSVFTVAYKVHVQSEPYSFAFVHQLGDPKDNGLGMVTPLNEEPHPVLDWVRTRIILHLLENCDREKLQKNFQSLQETLLLFLRKLKQLSIQIVLPPSPPSKVIYTRRPNESGQPKNQVTIGKVDGTSSSIQKFWIKKRNVDDMPAHSARENVHEAEVVLAFPIDKNEIPVIADQHVFAFLPLQRVGFKVREGSFSRSPLLTLVRQFLIQSDFITQANREDATDCEWNQHLLNEVVKTFLRTVDGSGGFLEHPKMKYAWVRYIPTEKIVHDLWGQLRVDLIEALSTRRLFHSSDDQSKLWTAKQLRVVNNEFRDVDLDPLLPDLESGDTAYVSEEYDSQLDIPIMRRLGTTDLSISDFLERLKKDLDNEDESQLRSREDDDWHTRFSDLLIRSLEDTTQRKLVQRLPIIPLDNGSWVHSLNASIFFPTSGGVKIPRGLPLSLILEDTLSNERRKVLFSSLGITECDPSRIFPLIENRYMTRHPGSESPCFQDMKFLFWHNNILPSTHLIYVAATDGNGYRITPATKGNWMYCPESEDPRSMYHLLKGVIPDELKGQVKFAHIRYYDTLKECGLRNGNAGPEWLRSRVGIKVMPQLYSRKSLFSKPEMSAELKYIVENLPQHLLAVLEGNWHQYYESSEWDDVIRAAEIPILDCPEPRALETTYLPLPKLKTKARELKLNESFGFLKELDGMTDIEVVKWRFLEHFGVGVEEDVSFWLALLRKAREKSDVEKSHVFKIYSHLQTFTEEEDIERLQDAFDDDLIYIPSNDSATHGTWVDLWHCVWQAPNWYSYYPRLQSINEYRSLFGLIVTTLGLMDGTPTDYLDYLNHIQVSKDYLNSKEEEAKISLIYGQLNILAEDDTDTKVKEKVRSRMDDKNLVYLPKTRTWHSLSSCIWAKEHIQLPGKVSLASAYSEQESFFCKVLGVKRPSLEMHMRALVHKASDNPNKESILKEMQNICALSPKPEDLQAKLSKCACFPVRIPTGEIEWLTCTDPFAIVDRLKYGNLFRNEIKTLDFTLEEVHSLRTFLIGLKLEPWFMSKAVTEETRVNNGLLHQELTNDFRKKSYAICRYAAHLGAPDAVAVYSQLQGAEIYTSNDISKVASITLNGTTKSLPGDSAYFHIDGSDDQLKLYIPRSKSARQVCLARQLPITLLKYLGIQSLGKGLELGVIFTASSLFVVDEILEQDGIIEVDGVTRPLDDDESEAASLPEMTPSEIPTTSSALRTPHSDRSSEYFSGRHHTGRSADVYDDPFWTPATSVSLGSPSPIERPEFYQQLLGVVIQQAEHIEGLPVVGTSVVASTAPDRSFDPILAVSSNIPGENFFKIGAAGELFVYEILKSLNLPAFDYSCWQSTIRHRVAVHSRHGNLTRWSGSVETADIVYRDSKSTLTNLLIRQGYLDSSSWSGASPTYYIEVKATMDALENAFFCSQSQFDRMEEMQLPDDEPSDEVYILARVFGLGRSRMGLRLYFDPATLRMNSELKFMADRYTVTPS